ncbi:MAG: Ribonuclease E [Pseudolabrys sp.]|jgi:ribonuclease E|nr:Ribonuclease E [Pseudolabrys sp.]
MASKMLIDASHPEETRVVVMRGNRVEEFDFESANRKQLRGNIYLAKVTRVEPSLQAAFVDYGGNRHGFLAFSEIHPDYYQIPVADRQALLAEEERAHREADAETEHRRGGRRWRHRNQGARRRQDAVHGDAAGPEDAAQTDELIREGDEGPIADPSSEAAAIEGAAETMPTSQPQSERLVEEPPAAAEPASADVEAAGREETLVETPSEPAEQIESAIGEEETTAETDPASEAAAQDAGNGDGDDHDHDHDDHDDEEDEAVESVGGADALEEVQERLPRYRRQYKIQEVIKRRQVMLVQVVKEERGTKGAALTTYLSLAGRYSVLMPNTSRGGGISRKITSSEDRSRLKEIAQDLEVPEGMGVILRTAGASRTKQEVKRDFEYLLRIWETVRDLTLKSTAPTLVYEEGSLIKRSIRDLYSKDIEEIIVAGEAGYEEAKEFMRMLMPSHAKNVKLYRDSQPIFTRYGIESQLDAMFTPTVQLRSGGYIVINQTEALVAIDVNSGRATREHSIEDTAVKTNSEAAEEIARQLRLRDLAGLIVIDFIDMDEGRNNRTVERRLKDALKHDRARIQVGRISHFGLLEMSRQRIRSSVLESSTELCPVCGGSGHVRSVSSVALALLRGIEETLIKSATHNLVIRTRSEVALYVLNHKRGHLRALEERFQITLTVSADASVVGAQAFVIDRGEQVHTPEQARQIVASQQVPLLPVTDEDADDFVEEVADSDSESETVASTEDETAEAASDDGERDDGPRRRRRRRRGGRGRGEGRGESVSSESAHDTAEQVAEHEDHDGSEAAEQTSEEPQHAAGENGDGDGGQRRRRRRGRRGGRRHRRNGENGFDGRHDEHREPSYAASDDDAGGVSDNEAPAAPQTDFEPAADRSRTESVAEPPRTQSRDETPEAAETPDAAGPTPSRRGSTVRESPSTSQPQAAPSSSPVVSSTTDESGSPKRGWWGRRLLGK